MTVAADVAGPALAGFVLWIGEQARQRGLRRLRFLSRDGQVLYELTRRLTPGLGLEYVYICAALEMDRRLPEDDVRPLVHQVMDAFWCHSSPAEARAWGAYPYDSDPAGTAVRPLARPFDAEGRVTAAIARGWRDRSP